jgi:hypothetical protein
MSLIRGGFLTMNRTLLFVSAVLAAAIIAGGNTLAFAAGGNPAGNNGVVKINGEAVSDAIPNNDPHVDCIFGVEFYGYDKNNNKADVAFELQAPTNRDKDVLQITSGNLHPFIGEDTAGGGTDLDARETYKLSFTGQPQPNQGYHVKVTVNAPGSQGSTKKQKVFWVQPCAENSSQTPGQVLATSGQKGTEDKTGTQTAAILPETGSNVAAVVGLSSVVSAAAYGLYFWRTSRRES